MTKMNLSSYSGGAGGAKTTKGVRRKGGVSAGTAAKRARQSIGGGRKNLAARQSAALSEMAAGAPKRKGPKRK